MTASLASILSEDKCVWTVTGQVAAPELGPTLCHEHLFANLAVWFSEPTSASKIAAANKPVSIEMLGQLRRQPFGVTRDNLVLGDTDQAVSEVSRARMAGVQTIVDTTPPDLARDPEGLRSVALATGLNVVMGCGHYVEDAHPDYVRRLTEDGVAKELVDELRSGVGTFGIRPGVIGEIGTSGVEKGSRRKTGHVTAEEKKVLRGCARAALQTETAVSVHLDPRGEGAFDVVKILDEEGLPRDQVILGHLDHIPSLDYQERVADLGVFMEFDNFGREYYWDAEGVYWNNDFWRVHTLARLIRTGHRDQLLVSQDVCMKMDLRSFGGYGYDHIMLDILPALHRAGVSNEDIQLMLVANPARALCRSARE